MFEDEEDREMREEFGGLWAFGAALAACVRVARRWRS